MRCFPLRVKILFFTSALLLIGSCTPLKYGISKKEKKYAETYAHNLNAAFGIPVGSDQNKENLRERDEYVFRYAPQKGSSSWVTHRIVASDYGQTPRRRGRFLTDPLLPDSLQINHEHYTHSGYDRGHMVRSKERTVSTDSNRATFYMTNVFPQTPDLNRGVWLSFERFCEKLAGMGYHLYVHTGGIYQNKQTLKDEGNVAIPDSCYKTVLAIDTEGELNYFPKDTFTVAVVMPNIAGIRSDEWYKYITTVKAVEQSTGLNFYPLLTRKKSRMYETILWPKNTFN